ncbi:PHA/PHB synthase family protein [Arhodomonas aquaeolei]|uniref:PHA/PHB synthase family protein n=1 Tax=Arhodomonas aquaeolei TaxID=2369 RepID=UPI00037BF783|nr:alpha/beta fold hydrolase [Arhodomonas aquaeolei]
MTRQTQGGAVNEAFKPNTYMAHALDRAFKAALARATNGLTPAGLASVGFEWFSHLAASPGKQLELVEEAMRSNIRLTRHAARTGTAQDGAPCIEPASSDHRFDDEGWCHWPYNLIAQSFLLQQQWWDTATTDIDGLSDYREEVVSFTARQLLDRFSPTNYPLLNPEVTRKAVSEGGMNFIRGIDNFVEDWERLVSGKPPVGTEDYRVGENLATTPGKVVYRNNLIELIQYSPSTETVHAEPVLIVPAWIMKYYILDLSAENSLVRYLVDNGHTVFMISWRNPDSEDRHLGMDDYRTLGPMAALDVINEIVPDRQVHGVGYCLGGTLLSIAAAAMGRDGDERLASMTTLATQVDFTEAGELMLFISESEVDLLENMMWEQGYLDGHQMAGAFQLLRSNDLVWSRMVREYLLGERQPMNDLMAWNADLTRMPYRMHTEYLRRLFLNNELATGRYIVNGRPVAIPDIRMPIFAVGTVKDHVAPWHSVYKIHLLADVDEITFVLTSGGHNAGIVSEPGHPRRRFQMHTHTEGDTYIDPETWRDTVPAQDGSWWPAWQEWLAAHSSERIAPPPMGGSSHPPLKDAPGDYVLQR